MANPEIIAAREAYEAAKAAANAVFSARITPALRAWTDAWTAAGCTQTKETIAAWEAYTYVYEAAVEERAATVDGLLRAYEKLLWEAGQKT